MKLDIDTFSGFNVYPAKGRLFVRSDSKVFRFSDSKTERLFHNRKNPRKVAWTTLYRRMHRKGVTETIVKKRTRKTVKYQRGITGASLAIIAAKRAETSEVRSAIRAEAIAKTKAAKKEKQEKVKVAAAARPPPAAPKFSKHQFKGGKSGR
ncbi:ribosomal protein L24e-domain-containing protein [Cantharellus anzutake]|uniref:ribosomal protein L24e-domain-containing protein n=1 Tax=Cantharellus anzutake TaxID=1750568 RepID=UPI001902D718|nr:ribosomal protein L24e-domain-containing protein [Cantharellus anzutake]XP_038911871.1 ribosomal protein L24e-domain-containing protein [Cantharellus anzutake]KAF8319843.1 ribosomal protein L24e-domain-containing protein [Cantharellus anzutake]KAF8324875.1 ribosomal protein L24e-domain-containing protein [Cantharellus anzutake]